MPKVKNFSAGWLVVWAVFLALGWLLPNHYRPWTSFHSEVWVAFALITVVPWMVFRAPPKFSCDAFVVSVLAAAVVPFVQLAFGQIYYFGHAWINSLYLLGLLIAILTGYCWERSDTGRLIDMLCFAIGLASLLSVFFQFYQWLDLDSLGIWLCESDTARPAANLGQPNQLATLLLWGVLSTFWAWLRSRIGVATAVLLALFLLFGVALTGSRTAWLGVGFVIAAGWWWRGIWNSKYVSWVLSTLGFYFAVCVAVLNFLGQQNRLAQMAASPTDARLAAWQLLVKAVLESPIFGYGWNQTASAHILFSEENPALHVVFGQAHNLFLDLILWCGLPVGGLLSWAILSRFWRTFRQVNSPENAVLFFFLLILANHALLEFPLHYAYFLLPAGLILGTVIARDQKSRQILELSRRSFAVLGVVSAIMLSITLIDYLKVENSYSLLRIEWAGYKLASNPQPPDVIALNQWHHIIKHARIIPRAGMSESELEEMRQITLLAHKPVDFRVLASALALNGRQAESELWLKRLCKVESVQNCEENGVSLERKRDQTRHSLLLP